LSRFLDGRSEPRRVQSDGTEWQSAEDAANDVALSLLLSMRLSGS
jgi:hypothetical protein